MSLTSLWGAPLLPESHQSLEGLLGRRTSVEEAPTTGIPLWSPQGCPEFEWRHWGWRTLQKMPPSRQIEKASLCRPVRHWVSWDPMLRGIQAYLDVVLLAVLDLIMGFHSFFSTRPCKLCECSHYPILSDGFVWRAVLYHLALQYLHRSSLESGVLTLHLQWL